MGQKRLKLGIIFNFSSSWMGGIIYIINVVKTLEFLDDKDKPEIFLFYRPGLEKFLAEFKYPYLNKIEWAFPSQISGNIKSKLLRKNLFVDKILKEYSLDAIYPMHNFPVRTKTNVKLISWWADLQHKHYPEFFTKMQLFGRKLREKHILKNSNHLVVSSQDVLDDFNRFYKLPGHLNVHIFHFVSIIDNLEKLDITELKEKYKLPQKYYMVSNQFHKHKNHRVLLQALVKLKQTGIDIHIAMTGKFPDAEHSTYMAELHKIIDDNQLQNHVTMLGIISRSEQLELMKHSQAVLQPSLFEGWSTVIEDAKSLQVPVVASNLKVNIEQLGKDGVYFDPHDSDELVKILTDYPERNINDTFYEEYSVRVKKAAGELLNIFKP